MWVITLRWFRSVCSLHPKQGWHKCCPTLCFCWYSFYLPTEGWKAESTPGQVEWVLNPGPVAWQSTALPTELSWPGKLGLGAVLSQKQTDGQYHLVAYVSCFWTVYECNYHLTKQEFLALKWAITEQFQEYLLWKPFIIKTDNLFTYIMTTPNLDATQHHWVVSLVGFTFSIKYQKGWDTAAADALSWIRPRLDVETVTSWMDSQWDW